MTLPTLSRSSVHTRGSSSQDERHVSPSPLHAVARVLLVATLCGAPWAFGAVQTWAWGTLTVMSLLILVLWAAGCAHRGVLRLSWSPLYWPFLAFLAIAIAQLLAGWSLDRVATREAVLKLVTNFLFFFLVGQLLNAHAGNGRTLEWFGLIVTLLAFAVCFLALAQLYWGHDRQMIYWTFPARGAPFGPYVNHNNYAGLMEMLLPISVAYILSRYWHSSLIFLFWCGVGLVTISIWISGSRGATLGLFVEGMVLAGILLWKRPRGIAPRYLVLLAGVLLICGITFSWLVSTGRVGGRAWSVFETHRSLGVTLGDRWRVGIDTLHMIRTHPWTGVGVGCFESIFPKYLSVPMEMHWTHAHDDILEAVAETGLPGLALILVALALFLRVAFHRLKVRLRYGWGWMQMGAALGVVGLLVHSLVDFNLRVPANAAWFVVCLAIATHPRSARRETPKVVWEPAEEPGGEFLTQ